MFVIEVTQIKYPQGSSEELPTDLTLSIEEVINNEYLDAELANHVYEIVGVMPDSLQYSWKYDHYYKESN